MRRAFGRAFVVLACKLRLALTVVALTSIRLKLNAVEPSTGPANHPAVLIVTSPKHVLDCGLATPNMSSLGHVLLKHPRRTDSPAYRRARHPCYDLSRVSIDIRPIFEGAWWIPIDRVDAIILQGNVVRSAARAGQAWNQEFTDRTAVNCASPGRDADLGFSPSSPATRSRSPGALPRPGFRLVDPGQSVYCRPRRWRASLVLPAGGALTTGDADSRCGIQIAFRLA